MRFTSKFTQKLGSAVESIRFTTLFLRDLKAQTSLEKTSESKTKLADGEDTRVQVPSRGTSYKHQTGDRFLFELEDCQIFGPSGFVYKNKKLVLESTSWNAYQGIIKGKNPKKLRTKFWTGELSTVLPHSSYYHWLLEDLPAFLSVWTYHGNVQLWCHTKPPRFVETFIRDYAPDKFHFFSGSISFDKYTFLTKKGINGVPQESDIRMLRSYFNIHDRGSNDGLVIYVSRLRSSRSPKKEKSFEKKIEEAGAKVIRTEDLDFRDQVSIFSKAKVVIGPHGAGLSNSVFMSNGKLIEIVDGEKNNDCFRILAEKSGCEHHRIFAPQGYNNDVVEQIYKVANLGLN